MTCWSQWAGRSFPGVMAMTEQRRKRANALIMELAAIQAEVDVLREGEAAESSSLMTTLEVGQLGEARDFIEGAIGALKGAVL